MSIKTYLRRLWPQLLRLMRRWAYWGYRRLPPGVRAVAGVLLVIGGFLGFLPVLGFWMIPVGAVLIAIDVPPLRRRMRGWLARNHRRARDGANGGVDAPPGR